MVDDGEEDDLNELLEVIGAQQGLQVLGQQAGTGNAVVQNAEGQNAMGQMNESLVALSNNQVGATSGMEMTIMMLLKQQAEQNQQNSNLLNLLMSDKESGGQQSNKRRREEVNYHPQEPVMINKEAYKILDDAHEVLDIKLRQRLRPINACPTTYWVKGSFKSVERPILGASVFLAHLMPGAVNEHTICKHHDRSAYIELRNYWGRNSGVLNKNLKKLSVKTVGEDYFDMGLEKEWASPNKVWDVMDSAFNFIAVEHMVRSYSYAGLAMLRCLHECRYFCGVVSNPR